MLANRQYFPSKPTGFRYISILERGMFARHFQFHWQYGYQSYKNKIAAENRDMWELIWNKSEQLQIEKASKGVIASKDAR